MKLRLRRQALNLFVVALMFAAGLVAAAYVLVHERLPVPFPNTYNVQVELTAADGVVPGLGQPVNVAGVQVGSVTAAHVDDGLALLTLQLQRGQVPHVYTNADAALDPITPLGDVEVNLSPGGPPARRLGPGQILPVGETTAPVQFEDLLSNLDSDTRAWLTSLTVSLGQGTAGRGEDIRRALATLGPSTAQVREITSALATRRHALALLVHNVAILTRAASSNGQLSQLVVAGDETLHALAAQDVPLKQSIALMPGALTTLDATLTHLHAFADQLDPTLTSLLPAVERLPETMASLRPFAAGTATLLATPIRPFVTKAAPLVETLAGAAHTLTGVLPALTTTLNVTNYLLNELAYNPGGKNQGYLYWADWWFHNWNSVFSTADAHGVVPRVQILLNCNQLLDGGAIGEFVDSALGAAHVC